MFLKSPKKGRRMAKKVVLLEHEGQEKNFLKQFKGTEGQKLIVALSPFVMHELDKQNFPYKIPEDYYNPRELYELGIGNYKKVENLCAAIDGSIHHACPTIARLGIKPAMFSFLDIKILYDCVTARLFQLFKLIESETPAAIFTYADKQYPFKTICGFDYRESVYTRLLTLPGWEVPVKVLPYVPYPAGPGNQKKISKKMMWWLQRHPKLLDLATGISKRGWRDLPSKLKGHLHARKDMQVIFFGQGFDWDDCREQIQSVGIDPIFNRIRDNLEYWMSGKASDKLDADVLRGTWEGLRTNDKFRKFFIWNNLDFFPVIEERLQFLVERLTPACLNAYEDAAEILKRRKVKAFLAASFDSCTGHSASQAARDSNVPVVTWQHGAYGYMKHPMVNYLDFMSSDFHFVYGDGVLDRYTESAKRFGARLISIGSPSLEVLYRMPQPKKARKIVRLDPRKKVVVYALTTFYQNTLYISHFPPPSDNQLWCAQRAVLNVLGKHDDYTVVVKTQPCGTREPPVRSYGKENRFENCHFIKDECTFTDLLPIADLVVLDFPSTPLLQALTTSKPIFVFTGRLCLDAQAKKLLERRVFCYDNPRIMANDLDLYLSESRIDKKVDLNDKEFLKAYGISSHGVGSGIRAAKMLKKIMMKGVAK